MKDILKLQARTLISCGPMQCGRLQESVCVTWQTNVPQSCPEHTKQPPLMTGTREMNLACRSHVTSNTISLVEAGCRVSPLPAIPVGNAFWDQDHDHGPADTLVHRTHLMTWMGSVRCATAVCPSSTKVVLNNVLRPRSLCLWCVHSLPTQSGECCP